VTVDELVVVGTTPVRTPIIGVQGSEPTLTLPPRVLKAGHTYVVVAACIAGGFVDAATGDFQTVTLPITIGQADSGVFTVVAP